MGDNMNKLDLKSSMLTMVIQQEFKENHRNLKISEIEEAVRTLGNYFIISHASDTDEDGKPKTPHYHVILQSNVCRKLGSVLKLVSSNLRIPDYLVTIAPVNDLLQNIRYLTHADDKHKYQYKWEDVVTNDYRTLEDSMSYVANLSTNSLINICKEEQNKLGVLRRIGLQNFKKYLAVINNIFEFCHEETKMAMELELEKQLNRAYGNYSLSAEEQARRDYETILRIEKDIAISKSKIDDRKPYPTKEDLPTKASFKNGNLNY